MRGQLDVDVVGRAERRRDLVARGSRPADVHHDPERVPASDAGLANQALSHHLAPVHGIDSKASPFRGPDGPLEQRLAVDGQLAARRVERGHE